MNEFKVLGMTCGHCAKAITMAVKRRDPEATIEIDLANHSLKVDSRQDRQSLADALAEAGYPASA